MNTILIIEDQPAMRRNLTTILEMEGFEVLAAENGRVGLELARARKPGLVLCDVMMPEMDGYAVLAALRADAETALLPFVFLTAKGDRTDHRLGMNLGADDYLAKPVSKRELLEAVQARLKRHQAQAAGAGKGGFNPDFSSSKPLEKLGLTPREAEVLLWVTQGKSNAEVGLILGMSEKTVKKHLGNLFEKLGLDNRNAATLRALEVLAGG